MNRFHKRYFFENTNFTHIIGNNRRKKLKFFFQNYPPNIAFTHIISLFRECGFTHTIKMNSYLKLFQHSCIDPFCS